MKTQFINLDMDLFSFDTAYLHGELFHKIWLVHHTQQEHFITFENYIYSIIGNKVFCDKQDITEEIEDFDYYGMMIQWHDNQNNVKTKYYDKIKQKASDYHNQSMNIAEQVYLVSMKRLNGNFSELSEQAFELENKAVTLLKILPIPEFSDQIEPSLTVLTSSAAYLAFDCKKYDDCISLCNWVIENSKYNEYIEQMKQLKEETKKENK